MKTIHSLPSPVDGIFEELTRLSHAELHCTTISSLPGSGMAPTVKLDAVNDCSSANDYRKFLSECCLSTINLVIDAQQEMEMPAKIMIFDQALKCCRRLASASIKGIGDKNRGQEIKTWMFRHFEITLDGQTCTDERIRRAALQQSNHHAHLWHLLMKSLCDRLYYLSCIAGYTMPFISQNQSPASPQRIKPCCTVALAAALTRILYEDGVFKDYNKAELCRQVASLISTPNQPKVSPNNFKNLFDMPDPKALLHLEKAFGKWMKISEELRETK